MQCDEYLCEQENGAGPEESSSASEEESSSEDESQVCELNLPQPPVSRLYSVISLTVTVRAELTHQNLLSSPALYSRGHCSVCSQYKKRSAVEGLIEIQNPNRVSNKNKKATEVDLNAATVLSRRER